MYDLSDEENVKTKIRSVCVAQNRDIMKQKGRRKKNRKKRLKDQRGEGGKRDVKRKK